MNSFVILLLSAVALASAADLNEIMDVDLKELLSDEARRKQIFDCMLDAAPCGEYQAYKDVVPGIIETQCAKCTPEQKTKFQENTKYLSETYPTEFNSIMEKYAPKPQKAE